MRTMEPSNTQWLRSAALVAALLTAALSTARAQAPATAPRSPVPAAVASEQRADKPLKASPPVTTLRASLAGKALTIDDAVAIALSTNRSLASAVESVLAAHGNTTATRAGQWLSVDLGYTFTRNNEQIATQLGDQSLVVQKQYVSQASASISLPIDITGALQAATSQAEFQEIAARLDVKRVRNDVILAVKQAFYECLRDQALATVAQSNLENAQTQLHDAQIRLSAGTVTRYDVLSADAAEANAQQSLRQAQTTLDNALGQLKSAIGIDINTPVQITTEGAVEIPASAGAAPSTPATSTNPSVPAESDLNIQPGQKLGDQGASQVRSLGSFTVSENGAFGPDYDALLGEALQRRPEIQREDANIAAAKKGIAIARSNNLPTVRVGYNESFTPDASGLSTQTLTGYSMLSINVPVFDSGVTRGRVQAAQAQYASTVTNRRAQVDAVKLEVRQRWLDVAQDEQQIGAARKELAQADEAYRLAQLRYNAGVTTQSGVSPLIELSNAQRALAQAQSDYVNALYSYNSARSAMDRAAGRYAITPTARR